MFDGIYKDRRIYVTGHTGFKGAWLCAWLKALGGQITGYSLDLPGSPNHFDLLQLPVSHVEGDIRDLEHLSQSVQQCQPEIVFHLAAQPLVRLSYAHPAETYSTNVMGTVNILEACRRTPGVKAIINITTDKCYENREWLWGYREDDALGGRDPYSSSKACSELVTSAYRQSFFAEQEAGPFVASARSGNVIGGGDWAPDRIVPDMVRAALAGRPVQLRHPAAVRPWQHVLEPLAGYLQLGALLLNKGKDYAQAWNFGPDERNFTSVAELVELAQQYWDRVEFALLEGEGGPHEAGLLKLDSAKARQLLGWKPVWNCQQGIERTVSWYRAFYEEKQILTQRQIEEYMVSAAAAESTIC